MVADDLDKVKSGPRRVHKSGLVALVGLVLLASAALIQNVERAADLYESGTVETVPIDATEKAPVKWFSRRLLSIEKWTRRQEIAQAEIESAIAAKREVVSRLEAENERLRLEQEEILNGRGILRGGAFSRKKKQLQELALGNIPSEGIQTTSLLSTAPVTRSTKRKYLRIKNTVSNCVLFVPGAQGDDDWLRCERDADELDLQTIFQVTPSHALSGAIRLRSQAGAGGLLEVIPPSEQYAWVLRASLQKEQSKEEEQRSSFEIVQGTSLKNVKTHGCITVIRSTDHEHPRISNVRAHGNKPNNKEAGPCSTPFASFHLQWLDDDTMQRARRKFVEDKEAEKNLHQAEAHLLQVADQRWHNTTEKRVIAYGLYGSDPKYCTGAIRNSELVHTVFPGWTTRFYARSDVPNSVLDTLRKNGAEIIPMGQAHNGNNIAGMFWRFLVADDPTVDRFIVRDSDSRLNPRERAAVEEWIQSGKAVHSIRDHPNHDRPLNGGLWGGVKNCVPGIKQKIHDFSNKKSYGGDLVFLNTVVWPQIKNDQISHDAYTCGKYPNSFPFPTRRPANYQHVGQVFSAADQPRMKDINGFMRGRPIPVKCRKNPEWKFG